MSTNYDIVMRGLPIRASDIMSLRTNLDADLGHAGLSYPWTWTSVSANSPIQSKHLTEIRGAIQMLWDDRDAGDLPPWQAEGGTQLGVASSALPGQVLAPNVVQARTWLGQYERGAVPDPIQGIDSLSYRPNDEDSPEISSAWAADVTAIAPEIQVVRSIVTAREGTDGLREILSENTSDVNAYRRSLRKYRQDGRTYEVFLVVNIETYYRGGQVDDPILPGPGPDQLFPSPVATNTYIEEFAAEMKALIPLMRSDANGNKVCDNFIIWNEPNDYAINKRLEEYTFGAMLHRVWQECVKGNPTPPRLYPAGIQTVIGHPGSATDYMRKTIEYVRYRMDYAGESGWPWSGLNFHVHQQRDQAQFTAQFDNISSLRNANSQSGELLIGEWGVNVANSANLSVLYNQLVGVVNAKPTTMFYFSHQEFSEKDEHNNDVQWGCRVAGKNNVGGRFEYIPAGETALYDELGNAL